MDIARATCRTTDAAAAAALVALPCCRSSHMCVVQLSHTHTRQLHTIYTYIYIYALVALPCCRSSHSCVVQLSYTHQTNTTTIVYYTILILHQIITTHVSVVQLSHTHQTDTAQLLLYTTITHYTEITPHQTTFAYFTIQIFAQILRQRQDVCINLCCLTYRYHLPKYAPQGS